MADDESIYYFPPDPEPDLPPGIERFKYANFMAGHDPKALLTSGYCVLHDLIELLVRNDVIKLSDLEAIKKDAYKDFLASRIVRSS